MRSMPTIRKQREIGRVMKISKLPLEMIRDPRKDSSNLVPKTKAMINGVASNLNFLKAYPSTPKVTITNKSKRLRFTL